MALCCQLSAVACKLEDMLNAVVACTLEDMLIQEQTLNLFHPVPSSIYALLLHSSNSQTVVQDWSLALGESQANVGTEEAEECAEVHAAIQTSVQRLEV